MNYSINKSMKEKNGTKKPIAGQFLYGERLSRFYFLAFADDLIQETKEFLFYRG